MTHNQNTRLNFRTIRKPSYQNINNSQQPFKLTLPDIKYAPSFTLNDNKPQSFIRQKSEHKHSQEQCFSLLLATLNSTTSKPLQFGTQPLETQQRKTSSSNWKPPIPKSVNNPQSQMKLTLTNFGSKQKIKQVVNKQQQLPQQKKRRIKIKVQNKQEQAKRISDQINQVKQIKKVIKEIEPVKNEEKKQFKEEKIEQKKQKVQEKKEVKLPPKPPQSMVQNQDLGQLIQCPQGCGRKFNQYALQKHAKACKKIFLSKRKEFNSQAKRVVSKEQADIIKKKKIQQKKKGGIGKKDDKEDKWKKQSQNFRQIVKAVKQENVQLASEQQQQVKVCPYCRQKFNPILAKKHIDICQAQKKRSNSKKKR